MAELPNLPIDPDVEKLVLGAMLSDAESAESVFGLEPHDFGLEQHRRIYRAALAVRQEGGQVDRITVATKLKEGKSLDSVGGLTYLTGLDDGLPRVYALESYVGTLRIKSTLRRAAIAAGALSERCCAPDAQIEDVTRAEAFLRDLAASAQKRKPSLKTIEEAIEEAGGLDSFIKPPAGDAVPTPWATINELLDGGFRAGQLIIVGARPGMGKSALAGQIALSGAHRGVTIFSLEMSAPQIWKRILAGASNIPMRSLAHSGREIYSAVEEVGRLGIRIDDTAGANVESIVRAVKATKKRGPVGLVMVDYLQLLKGSRAHRSRVEEVTEISRALKLAARELRVPFLVLAQLNRDTAKEDRAPGLHDLRESGSIEQDADVVILMYTPKKALAEAIATKSPSPLELILCKQRDGPTGSVHLTFKAATMQMWEGGINANSR